MSTNKTELVNENGYGAIDVTDEATNKFYVIRFTSVPYRLQDDVESYGNQLASGEFVFNAIYKFLGWHKSQFYVDPYKNKNCDSTNEHSCYSKSRR